ncbi:MAG: hypothetical protein M5U28_38055 [Sandaracinaceae bacterium]|nr:hypothetical protein [Sandaracinaceae bacterium]
MSDGPPTDGVTGPLALVPALLGQLILGDAVAGSKAVGLVATVAAVVLVVRRARRGGSARAAVAAALAFGGSTLAAWAVAGLETGLATLALTVAALSVTRREREHEDGDEQERGHEHGDEHERERERDDARGDEREREHERGDEREREHERGDEREREHERGDGREREDERGDEREREDEPGDEREREDERGNERERSEGRGRARPFGGSRQGLGRGVVAGLAVAALAWLRPELALACGFLLVVLVRAERRAGYLAIGLAALGAVSVVAFRLALFGQPLPLSAHAKPPDLANGLEYVARGVVIALGGGG